MLRRARGKQAAFSVTSGASTSIAGDQLGSKGLACRFGWPGPGQF